MHEINNNSLGLSNFEVIEKKDSFTQPSIGENIIIHYLKYYLYSSENFDESSKDIFYSSKTSYSFHDESKAIYYNLDKEVKENSFVRLNTASLDHCNVDEPASLLKLFQDSNSVNKKVILLGSSNGKWFQSKHVRGWIAADINRNAHPNKNDFSLHRIVTSMNCFY